MKLDTKNTSKVGFPEGFYGAAQRRLTKLKGRLM